MNGVEWKVLNSVVGSLVASTDLAISRQGLTATLARRNSPYVSHRQVTFVPKGIRFPDTLVVANLRNVLYIGLTYDAVPPETWDRGDFETHPLSYLEGMKSYGYETNGVIYWATTTVPEQFLRPVLDEAVRYGLLDRMELAPMLVPVAFPVERVYAWDEQGKPIFYGDLTSQEQIA